MTSYTHKAISTIVLAAFIVTSVQRPSDAQAIQQTIPWMPKPGVMVHLSPEFTPALLKGIVIHPENALKFDFIVEKGDQELTPSQKRQEYTKLIKYFLASLAIPDEDQWVNLSPYEKNRIIREDFGKTEMGRDLLAEDYILKQITASLIYPEEKLGQEFWDRVYAQAQQQYGTTNIPVNTFNKVWIVPDGATIYEKGNIAFVLRHHLKVMLEEDYLSLQKHSGIENTQRSTNQTHSIASKIVKEIVLPQLEKEVNEGKNFASLRQVYSGMILAAWYKRALKESLLNKIYANKSKLKGVDQDPQANEIIYQQYLKAYKKGVFNFIKEDVDKYTNETIPRKYFSGGTVGDNAMFEQGKVIYTSSSENAAQVAQALSSDDLVKGLAQEFRTPVRRPKGAVKMLLAGLVAGMVGAQNLPAQTNDTQHSTEYHELLKTPDLITVPTSQGNEYLIPTIHTNDVSVSDFLRQNESSSHQAREAIRGFFRQNAEALNDYKNHVIPEIQQLVSKNGSVDIGLEGYSDITPDMETHIGNSINSIYPLTRDRLIKLGFSRKEAESSARDWLLLIYGPVWADKFLNKDPLLYNNPNVHINGWDNLTLSTMGGNSGRNLVTLNEKLSGDMMIKNLDPKDVIVFLNKLFVEKPDLSVEEARDQVKSQFPQYDPEIMKEIFAFFKAYRNAIKLDLLRNGTAGQRIYAQTRRDKIPYILVGGAAHMLKTAGVTPIQEVLIKLDQQSPIKSNPHSWQGIPFSDIVNSFNAHPHLGPNITIDQVASSIKKESEIGVLEGIAKEALIDTGLFDGQDLRDVHVLPLEILGNPAGSSSPYTIISPSLAHQGSIVVDADYLDRLNTDQKTEFILSVLALGARGQQAAPLVTAVGNYSRFYYLRELFDNHSEQDTQGIGQKLDESREINTALPILLKEHPELEGFMPASVSFPVPNNMDIPVVELVNPETGKIERVKIDWLNNKIEVGDENRLNSKAMTSIPNFVDQEALPEYLQQIAGLLSFSDYLDIISKKKGNIQESDIVFLTKQLQDALTFQRHVNIREALNQLVENRFLTVKTTKTNKGKEIRQYQLTPNALEKGVSRKDSFILIILHAFDYILRSGVSSEATIKMALFLTQFNGGKVNKENFVVLQDRVEEFKFLIDTEVGLQIKILKDKKARKQNTIENQEYVLMLEGISEFCSYFLFDVSINLKNLFSENPKREVVISPEYMMDKIDPSKQHIQGPEFTKNRENFMRSALLRRLKNVGWMVLPANGSSYSAEIPLNSEIIPDNDAVDAYHIKQWAEGVVKEKVRTDDGQDVHVSSMTVDIQHNITRKSLNKLIPDNQSINIDDLIEDGYLTVISINAKYPEKGLVTVNWSKVKSELTDQHPFYQFLRNARGKVKLTFAVTNPAMAAVLQDPKKILEDKVKKTLQVITVLEAIRSEMSRNPSFRDHHESLRDIEPLLRRLTHSLESINSEYNQDPLEIRQENLEKIRRDLNKARESLVDLTPATFFRGKKIESDPFYADIQTVWNNYVGETGAIQTRVYKMRLGASKVLGRLRGKGPKDKAQAAAPPVGGIDLNAANLDLQIKRDGKGVPLPVSQQNLENIHIEGLIPVILDIKPATQTSLLSQLR